MKSVISSPPRSRRPMAAHIGHSRYSIRRFIASHKARWFAATAQKYYELFKKVILPKAIQYAREIYRQKMHIPVAAFVAIFIAVNIIVPFIVGIATSISKNPEGWESISAKLDDWMGRRVGINQCPADMHYHQATTDIDVKAMYDAIVYPGEESWNISYKGNEWDEEHLHVFVVPHSHVDPGWLKTIGEYYQEDVKGILDTVVTTLTQNPSYRFIWGEVVFLDIWWDDSSESKRQAFRQLVSNGQLEVVGGWVVPDEATSHYYAMITQMIEGHTWLKDTLGAHPRSYWAIDPFGYSPTVPYLLQNAGFDNMVIARAHHEIRHMFAHKQSLEFEWRQSWKDGNGGDFSGKHPVDQPQLIGSDAGRDGRRALVSRGQSGVDAGAAAGVEQGAGQGSIQDSMLCHLIPLDSYTIPRSCGPNMTVCCMFDFRRDSDDYCVWPDVIPTPQPITRENVAARVPELLDQWRQKSQMFATNVLLLPLGEDFSYKSLHKMNAMLSNYSLIFDYLNSQPHLKVKASFGTLADYFSALRSSISSRHHPLPSLSGDFFPYLDNWGTDEFWSGYYTSRPFWKRMGRELEGAVKAADLLFAFVAMRHVAKNNTSARAGARDVVVTKFLHRYAPPLVLARQDLSLFQHHDAITGTAKNHVVLDYGARLHRGIAKMQDLIAAAIPLLIPSPFTYAASPLPPPIPSLLPLSYRPAPELPARLRIIDTLCDGSGVQQVVVFNVLDRKLVQAISIKVSSTNVVIVDSSRKCVASQLLPDWNFDAARPVGSYASGSHRLFWVARVPAMGITTYLVGRQENLPHCQKAQLSRISTLDPPAGFKCPRQYRCITTGEDQDIVTLSNKFLNVTVYAGHPLMESVSLIQSNLTMALKEDFSWYKSQGGAYLFRPINFSTPIIGSMGHAFVCRGQIVDEMVSRFSFRFHREQGLLDDEEEVERSPQEVVSRTLRIYNVTSVQGRIIEVEHHINMTHSATVGDRELIVRYNTSVQSGTTFFTDLNSFQMARRDRSSSLSLHPPPISSSSSLPVQANYYPITSLAFIQQQQQQQQQHGSVDNGLRFSIHTVQAHGVTSLKSGSLEVMLDRCLESDDGKGLDQGVTDNLPTAATFHLLIEVKNSSALSDDDAHRSSSSSLPLRPSLLSHQVSARLNNPPLLFLGARGSAIRPHSTQSTGSMRSKQATEQAAANGTFDVDSDTQHVGCPSEVGDEEGDRIGQKDSSSSTSGTSSTDSSSSSSSRSRNFYVKGRWQLKALPQPFSLLSAEPLPCDAQIVSLNVHRPLGVTQTSAEPPFAAIIHRFGWDCAYSSVRPTDMGCSVPGGWDKGIPFSSLLSGLKLKGVKQYQLNLASTASGGSASSFSNGNLMLKPMEIGAVKFDV